MNRYRALFVLAMVAWLASGAGALFGWWSFHWAAFVSAVAGLPYVVIERKRYKDEEESM